MHLVVKPEDSGGPNDQNQNDSQNQDQVSPHKQTQDRQHRGMGGFHQQQVRDAIKGFTASVLIRDRCSADIGVRADATTGIDASLSMTRSPISLVLSGRLPQIEMLEALLGEKAIVLEITDGVCKFGDRCIYFHARPVWDPPKVDASILHDATLNKRKSDAVEYTQAAPSAVNASNAPSTTTPRTVPSTARSGSRRVSASARQDSQAAHAGASLPAPPVRARGPVLRSFTWSGAAVCPTSG